MKKTSFVIAAALMALAMGAARADDVTKNPGSSVNPNMGKGPAQQQSMSSGAPKATTTQATGSHDQSAAVKNMNNSEKSKVEAGGK